MKYTAAEVKKAIVAFVGFAITVVTTILAVGPDLIPDAWLPYITIAVAVAGTYGVFGARNLGTVGYDPTQSVATKEPNPQVD